MAFGKMDFYAESLCRMVSFHILLPGDRTVPVETEHHKRRMKTLYLFHGYTNNSWEWLLSSRIAEYSSRYNLAVVLPSLENSFYLDGCGTGRGYGTYVGKELVEYTRKVFGLSDKKEDTFVGGISMGGFGALHTGLAYPQTFSKIMALSSALIVHEIAGKKEGFSNHAADYAYYHSVFGNLDELLESRNNPEQLILDLQKAGEDIPGLFMACGLEDFLLQENRAFHQFLTEHDVPVRYQESAGSHDFDFWNQYLEPAIQWMIGGV